METILVIHDDETQKDVWLIRVEYKKLVHPWVAIADALDEYSKTDDCYRWCVERDFPYISALDFEDIPFEFFENWGIISMSFVGWGDGYLSEVTARCEKFDNSKGG